MMAVALKEKTNTAFAPENRRTQLPRMQRSVKFAVDKKIKRLAGLFVVLVVVNIIVQALVAQAQYRLGSLEDLLAKQERTNNILYLNLANLGSDERIERIAEEKLGMHYAQPGEIALVPAGERENPAAGVRSDEERFPLFLASRHDVHQTGIGQRFNEWMQGLGRTLAGSGPSDLE